MRASESNGPAIDFAAGKLADAIAFECIFQDGDMVDVIARQSAMLEELIAWLGRHGVEARALRYRRALTPAYQRQLAALKDA